MEGWRQRRLGSMGTIWKKKKERRRKKKSRLSKLGFGIFESKKRLSI
jgi:hypothetical protein